MARLNMTGTNRSVGNRQVTGVLVDPSDAAWAIVIQNTAGVVVFQAKGAAATSFYAPVEDDWEGINITTATNIARVIIYTR